MEATSGKQAALLPQVTDVRPVVASLYRHQVLEDKGFVTRTHHATDTRAKHLQMTAAGLKALGRAMPVVIDVQRRLFGEQGSANSDQLTMLVRVDGEWMAWTRPSVKQHSPRCCHVA